MCIQAVGNLYGFPPAGQKFRIEFDKCVKEMGYDNTPWDLKLFFIYEWEVLVKNFNAHKYTVTDCTEKEFVGINITHDVDYNHYMDQTRMITEIIKEANLTGAKDERQRSIIQAGFGHRRTEERMF